MSKQQRDLAQQALNKVLEVREAARLDDQSPLCVYALCDKLSLPVRFVAISSMEGTYIAGEKPHIILSSLRPFGRRAFTCAHEVGHHVFGHGSAIDELRQEAAANPIFNPKEFLAETFAGFLLMPQIGVRKAFRARGWDPKTASPEQVFTVACSFGVGYETLASHMTYGIREIGSARFDVLKKTKLPTIRRTLLGEASEEPLIVADTHYTLPTLDAEVGMHVLLPDRTEVALPNLAHVADLANGRLFRANRPGLVQVHAPGAAGPLTIVVRISRFQYVGLSKYRHFEEADDDSDG